MGTLILGCGGLGWKALVVYA